LIGDLTVKMGKDEWIGGDAGLRCRLTERTTQKKKRA